MEKIPLHPTDTPMKAYGRLMRFGAFAMAARVAHQYGLGRDLLIRALDRALCRFEKLGFPELAVTFAEELGFTVIAVTPQQLPQMMRALQQLDDRDQRPTDPRLCN